MECIFLSVCLPEKMCVCVCVCVSVCVCGEREIREEEERDFSDFVPGSVFILFTCFSSCYLWTRCCTRSEPLFAKLFH